MKINNKINELNDKKNLWKLWESKNIKVLQLI